MIPEVWQFSSDLNNCISCSSLHQPCFQYKVTHRTASQVLHAFVHSIPHSLFSDWDWSWDSCSDQKGSQVSTDLVGSKRGRREHLTEIWPYGPSFIFHSLHHTGSVRRVCQPVFFSGPTYVNFFNFTQSLQKLFAFA